MNFMQMLPLSSFLKKSRYFRNSEKQLMFYSLEEPLISLSQFHSFRLKLDNKSTFLMIYEIHSKKIQVWAL